MKFVQISGAPQHLTCRGCGKDGIGGTDPYKSASSGDLVTPDTWYVEAEYPFDTYCAECAAKLSQEDPTRSVSQFYADTKGTEILPEILRENESNVRDQ